MLPTIDPVGAQIADDLEVHEARSDARSLIGALLDALDTGSGDLWSSCFTEDGTWADALGRTSTGRTELVEHLRAVRDREPFSIHWAGNEDVRVDADGSLVGTWLWSCASRRGSTLSWSGGDLTARLVATSSGLRISALAMADRYRTPEDVGWLHRQIVPTSAADLGDPAADEPLEGIGPGSPPTGRSGDRDERLGRLLAESELRWVVGEYCDAVETGVDVSEWIDDVWTEDGECRLGPGPRAEGRDRVRDAHARDASATTVWIRPVSDVVVRVEPGSRAAAVRWRDLWTAEVDGVARWVAHAYDAGLVVDGGRWRFARLTRTRLLDRPYAGR